VFDRKPYYSPTELAREVGVSHDMILDMIHAKTLFAVKLGPRTYRVPLGAALAKFAPHEIGQGETVVLPDGSSDQFFESLEREESTPKWER
jgi:excisionase family DNA binding protein